MRTIVFGASGFVGSALVERLRARGEDFVAVIRSAGNAWRLARHGMPMRIVDITSRKEVADVMRGCTHVVNCTRGGDDVMIGGLKNLLAEAKTQGIRLFVHLSSVAVYGDPPPSASEVEFCPAKPAASSYGEMKLEQDDLVERAHQGGLSCAVLCPPNISGVYSTFVANVLEDMRAGTFRLVDGGARPLNVVDVENLCHAIELARSTDTADGKRIFVTDGESITWGSFAKHLLALAERNEMPPSIPLAEAGDGGEPAAPRGSVWRAAKHLVSSEVRAALRRDPLLARLDARVRATVALLPRSSEESLRYSIEGPTRVAKAAAETTPPSRYIAQQRRGVVHRIARARQVLGYAPIISFDASMANFSDWYRATRGMDGDSWPLVRELL